MFFVQRTSADPFDKRHDVIFRDPVTGYQHVQVRCHDKGRAKNVAYIMNKKGI